MFWRHTRKNHRSAPLTRRLFSGTYMPEKRIAQVNELIAQELGTIIAREVEFPEGSLATITKVTAAADLKNAFVWLSILPKASETDVLKLLRKQAGRLQRFLNKRLAMQYIPKIIFKIDTGEDEKEEHEIHSMERMLDEIKKELGD